jgi:hypothetical protein
MLKNQNLTSQELMTCVGQTLDLEDLRRDIISFALTSEIFYSFNINYYVSLLLKMEKIGPHPDFDDLIKAI